MSTSRTPFRQVVWFQVTFFLVCVALALSPSCQRATPPANPPAATAPAAKGLPPATPGLEPHDEDYAAARHQFHTKLLRKGPAPQPWQPVKPPNGVTEVEYVSNDLRLKAWVNIPKGNSAKQPAVLFLHGGWAFGEDDWDMARPYRDAGFITMTPLLRGENGQPGVFSLFYDEVDDVLAGADFLSKQAYVDPKRLYISGHSVGGTLTMLAALTSDRFRAAASISGSPDQVAFTRAQTRNLVPFDPSDMREFRMRSPVAFAGSFKCPTRLFYGSAEPFFEAPTRRTASLAKGKGLDVEAHVVPGDHMSCVPGAMKQAIEFFRSRTN